MLDRRIAPADHYAAMTNALRCWVSVGAAGEAWLEYAAITAVGKIAVLLDGLHVTDDLEEADALNQPVFSVREDGPVGDSEIASNFSAVASAPVFPQIINAMATESGAPAAVAAALFGRLFVDVLATPAFKEAFLAASPRASAPIVAEWAKIATAAWMVGWYPDLPPHDGVSFTAASARLASGGPRSVQFDRLLDAVAAEIVLMSAGEDLDNAVRVAKGIIGVPGTMTLPMREYHANHIHSDFDEDEARGGRLFAAAFRDESEGRPDRREEPAPMPALAYVAAAAPLPRHGDPLVGFSTALPASSGAPARGIHFVGAAEGPASSGIRREGVILFAEGVFRSGGQPRERRLAGMETDSRN